MRLYYFLLLFLPISSFAQKSKTELTATALNKIATAYVRLGLSIGQYDSAFVDAYYGPDSLKPSTAKKIFFPRKEMLLVVKKLQLQLKPFMTQANEVLLRQRATWMTSQLTAFGRRIKMFAGKRSSFDQQAKELFGVVPPAYSEDSFRSMVKELDKLLPGSGSINNRFQLLANRFIIPHEKLDTVIKTTIAESKKRTQQYLTLPATEDFHLEYVTGKSWSGYNWYQGNFTSLLQYNTDVTSFVSRILDIASHEGYPGHHVYNSLLEKSLYKDKGWIEISLYPLFSPQSLIAEGSANFGIDVAFPGKSKMDFIKNKLLPLAGLDTSGLTAYLQATALKGKLQNVRTEVTRRIVDGRMSDGEAVKWLMDYGLFNEKDAARSLAFSKQYQSYVMNYTFGMDLVKDYIESKGGTERNPAKRWQLFEWLLSNEVRPVDLLLKKKK